MKRRDLLKWLGLAPVALALPSEPVKENPYLSTDYKKRLESKTFKKEAVAVDINPDGGFLVTEEQDRAISDAIAANWPIRELHNARILSGSIVRKRS